jgi:glycosyltransferase involved in cell wall biosynthesis
MIKACFIIKYPPIQGGVSMMSYWLARGLAERGHEIHVVTNAMEVEDEYRIYMDEDDRASYEPRRESGGFVQVHHTQTSSRGLTHIPQSNAFVAKLSSVATQVVRQYRCDVVFAFYLQPYGLAAHLVSHWTGVPYMVKHAGSDLGRLMKQPTLTTAYREVVKAADTVWTSPAMKNTFLALGGSEEHLWFGRTPQVPSVFNPTAPVLDLNALLQKLAQVDVDHVRNVLINRNPIDSSKPTIGIYGKVGEVKGSFDLLRALALLKGQGLDFNLVALTQGTALPAFKQAIHELDLQERSWTLPFLPHWRVPGFIRACTAVCFLEREFPIAFHTPTIPREVMASGTCLVLSREIADKQHRLKSGLIDGENFLLVENPREHADLARQLQVVIEDPARAARIGLNGAKVYFELGSPPAGENAKTAIELFEEQLMRLRDKGPGQLRHAVASNDTLRKGRLRARLPWTSGLLADSWHDLVSRYCDAHAGVSGNQFDDAVRLCEFLEANVADRNDGRPLVDDALRYEKHHNLLYVEQDGRPQNGSAGMQAEPAVNGRRAARSRRPSVGKRALLALQSRAADEVLALRPVKVPGVRVEMFARDFEDLANRLANGDVPRETSDAQTIVLFKKELNFVPLELKINEATRVFLDLCDGQRTVKATIAELGEFYRRSATPIDEGELTHEVMQLLRELTGKEIVRLLAER